MKQNDLEKYRNTSGFIDMDKALNENKVNIMDKVEAVARAIMELGRSEGVSAE